LFAFLFRPASHFNLANCFTFVNVSMGVIALFFIAHGRYDFAIIAAWIGGAFDIFDGKIARKFKLSNPFGVQIDSFADFITFVLAPSFLIYEVIFKSTDTTVQILGAAVMLYYILAGLRRLITFNLTTHVGEVARFFTGVPTPLGAILLFVVYLTHTYTALSSPYAYMVMIFVIGALLNSKVKIPHP